MLEIQNKTLLAAIADEAVTKARANAEPETRAAWVNAIIKAGNLIQTGDLTFWTFDAETGELLLLSNSNATYSANGTCQCRAFTDFQRPCWHRAAARLLARYFAQVEKPVDREAIINEHQYC